MHGLERGMVDIACIIVGQWRQLAVVRVGRAMEDLSKRFAKVFGKEKDVPVGPPVEDEKIAFGKKHLGKSFKEAWADTEWVRWTVTYMNRESMSEPQRRWIEYVQQQVEKVEQASGETCGGGARTPPASGGETGPPMQPQPPASGGETEPPVAETQHSASGGGEAEFPANGRLDRIQAKIDAMDHQIQMLCQVVSQLMAGHREP